jgi:hypothetical protein
VEFARDEIIFMKALFTSVLGVWLLAGPGAGITVPAAETNAPLNFQEVYNLIRTNLAGVSAADLDRAAVQGLLKQFQSQVSLVPKIPGPGISETELLSRTNVFEEAYAYLRIARVEPGLAEQVQVGFEKLNVDKKLKGLVLDLRFARGQDYPTAVRVADRFIAVEQPQLTFGGALLRSTAKADAWTIPVVVLVNRQTAGAAEVLAALLRQNHVGLLIGAPTAGEASLFKEFVLGDGQRLRIATGVIKLGDGEPLSARGINPDIALEVSPEVERAYLADAYKEPVRGTTLTAGPAGTNNPPRRRLNEAELVRRQREGLNPDDDSAVTKTRPLELAKPVVRDPALARALDLLKGLAVVKGYRPR